MDLYGAKISREDRAKLVKEVKKEVYAELIDIFKEKDISDVRKTLRSELKAMKEAEIAVIHHIGDDQVRCVAEKDSIVCSVKDGKDWKPLNKHNVNKVHVMQYADRNDNFYGLDCKKIKDNIDCNFVSKERLEKAEKPFIPEGYGIRWTGPPGFQRVRCSVEDNQLTCKGSSETILGMGEEVVDIKSPDHFNKKTGQWEIGETIKEGRQVPAIKGEVPFEETGKLISLTTAGEKDLDGITFIELSEEGKSGRLVAYVLKGKPFMEREPESKMWVSDEDAGRIGQGYSKNRRKVNFEDSDMEFIGGKKK